MIVNLDIQETTVKQVTITNLEISVLQSHGTTEVCPTIQIKTYTSSWYTRTSLNWELRYNSFPWTSNYESPSWSLLYNLRVEPEYFKKESYPT